MKANAIRTSMYEKVDGKWQRVKTEICSKKVIGSTEIFHERLYMIFREGDKVKVEFDLLYLDPDQLEKIEVENLLNEIKEDAN